MNKCPYCGQTPDIPTRQDGEIYCEECAGIVRWERMVDEYTAPPRGWEQMEEFAFLKAEPQRNCN